MRDCALCRTPRLERYATETNKLIIRLNKLLTNLPSDPAHRKQHEKNVMSTFGCFFVGCRLKKTVSQFIVVLQLVPWLDGESVKLCPSCVKRFYLTRRQHHCRLCGCIMCQDCSFFLSIEDAGKLQSRRHLPVKPKLLIPCRSQNL